MKQFSTIIRLLIGAAGLLLACFAVYLSLETYFYLQKQRIAPDERAFQQHRMYCQMILLAVGAALILLAAPIPKGHTYRLGWTFIGGAIFLALFLRSFFQFIRQLQDKSLHLKEDASAEMAATIVYLILAVVCFKWKPKAVPNVTEQQ